ncbi:methylated-DNA-protein-cysteine methyltransferase related protein [Chitinophaga sp. YR573]|uniref:MGMT family protein n=1 Tax=Chitinophaga sp. YR573 TaxID=1881040 RepID=UPI0008B4DD29|nr:MGMT family protein [Chitinophaga sp. YR573]SEV96177.1 methylated-DNA-protein-cysteine methyltransferase related protein [Chitinophaga sp. YR573]
MKTNTIDPEAIYKAIFDVVRSIPKGRVSSYGAIAKAVGLKSGARMVGRAMSLTMGVKPAVPVQRVVNSTGVLSGDNGQRQKKLEAEGITVNTGRIVNFKKIFWDPMKEL